jgi:hypothetical protein
MILYHNKEKAGQYTQSVTFLPFSTNWFYQERTIDTTGSAFNQIVAKLKTQLETITIVNGFNTDVGGVYDEPVSPENIKKFPAINIYVGPESYVVGTNEAGRLMKTASVILDVYIQEKERQRQKITELLADIELVLYDDTIAKSRYNLCGKCLIMQPVQTNPFQIQGENHICGFEHEISIKYRQKRSDPTVLYN